MSVDLTGRMIFLASPGGMDDERRWVHEEIEDFNRLRSASTGTFFMVTGFEDVAGTVNRPQDAVNPLVREADFMVLLVGSNLGSPTTASPPFLTGIEEEFIVALQCLEVDDAPMRDIMLTFRSHDTGALRDPGPKLQEVLEFKNVVEATKEIFHVGTFESERDFRQKVRRQLEEWVLPLKQKTPRSCPRLLAALDRTERPAMAHTPPEDDDRLIQWAEEQAEEGLNTAADIAFARATTKDNPDGLRRYARFLQRTGQLERALRLDKEALELLAGSDSVQDVSLQADTLAHMAQLKRKLGDTVAAERLLDEAVRTARPYAPQLATTMGYILDQQGILAARLGDLDKAFAAYSEALELRTSNGDEKGRAQSLINLARVARDQGEHQLAVERLDEAIRILEPRGENRLLANALAALGDAVAPEDPDRGRELLERSMNINKRLGISDGVSVAANGLARLELLAGNHEAALAHAQRVFEISSESGNSEGMCIAHRLSGEVYLAAGRSDAAVASFQSALELALAQNDPAREAEARFGLARTYLELGDDQAADEQVKSGLIAANKVTNRRLINEFELLEQRD